MPTNNFKPFGIGSGANVTDQTAYEALAALLTGFQSGKASSSQINKALRQGTVMSSVLAQFISDTLGVDVLDNGVTDAVLANLKAALLFAGTGRLLNVQIFTSSGTYTPTAGTKSVIVEVQAGGGGGGGVGGSSSTTVSAGTGGGGGGYGKSKLTVAAATGQVVTVGGGGAGGNLTPTGGTAGGASSFGSLITCSGGSGGNGQNQATPPFTSTGVTGGTSTGGNICNVRGEASAHGVCVSASSVTSGSAGGSVLGSGGFSPANNGITPQAGQGYGGGGGSSYTNNLSGFSGAAGAPGIVIVWEYA